MEAINSFRELFLEVWKEGVFGLNASEIIIGIIIFSDSEVMNLSFYLGSSIILFIVFLDGYIKNKK